MRGRGAKKGGRQLLLGLGGFGGGCLFSQPIHLRPEASADLTDFCHEAKSVPDPFKFLFVAEEIEFMSTRVRYSKALDGTDYIPGCIGPVLGMPLDRASLLAAWDSLHAFLVASSGLNNIQDSDYQNVVIQMLCTAMAHDSLGKKAGVASSRAP